MASFGLFAGLLSFWSSTEGEEVKLSVQGLARDLIAEVVSAALVRVHFGDADGLIEGLLGMPIASTPSRMCCFSVWSSFDFKIDRLHAVARFGKVLLDLGEVGIGLPFKRQLSVIVCHGEASFGFCAIWYLSRSQALH